MTLNRLSVALLAVFVLAGLPPAVVAQAAAPATPSAAVPAPAPVAQPPFEMRTTTLAAKGLFAGNELTPAARAQLTELIVEALGLQVEVALVVPTGPWQLDGSGDDERHLTPARLAAVKRFLAERGVDGRRVFVESRIDEKIPEPRLEIQVGGRRAVD